MNLRYYTSALTLELDSTRCVGCGRCVEVCPHGVFALMHNVPGGIGSLPHARQPHRQSHIVARDRCMECGACALNCATGAIRAGAGVGCATAIINGMIRGTASECGCGGREKSSGCRGSNCDGNN